MQQLKTMHSWSNSVTLSMLRAREAMASRFRPILAGHGLTEPQWRVLRALSETKEMTMTETAEATMLMLPSVSRIVRDLEARGLIAKLSHGRKANQFHLRLKPKGEAVLNTVLPLAEASLGGMEKEFGPARMKQLLTLLDAFGALNEASPSQTIDAE